MRFTSVSSTLFATALALVACRSNPTTNGTDGPPGGGDGSGGSNGGFVTIQQVQNDSMPVSTPVSLQGVVVTAIDTFGARVGAFWVEEPEGGLNSGVQVFNAPLTSVGNLAVGDIVTITGAEKAEFALSSDTSGNTDTELEPIAGGAITVTKTGTGTVPAPVVVDALSIGQMGDATARNAAWEPYEGVLITVNTVSALSSAKSFGSGSDQGSFEITGTAEIENEIAAFPGAGSASVGSIKRGDCLASVTGVLDYFFTYNLLPITTSDLATGGTGCPAPEQAAGSDGSVCTNGMDDDGNGFADCEDLGCEAGAGAWLDPDNCVAATDLSTCGCSTNLAAGSGVNKVDLGTGSGAVILRNVIVTAVSTSGFWVSDALQQTQNGGVFVFTSSAPTVTVGQKLATVQGIAAPFGRGSAAGDLTLVEVGSPTVGTASAGGVVLPISSANAPVATVTSVANGVPFTGSVVQFKNVKVTTAPSAATHNQATLTDGTTTFTMDDEAFPGYGSGAGVTAAGTCYATLTGVMDLDTFDPQVRTINPRSATDMISVGGTCQ